MCAASQLSLLLRMLCVTMQTVTYADLNVTVSNAGSKKSSSRSACRTSSRRARNLDLSSKTWRRTTKTAQTPPGHAPRFLQHVNDLPEHVNVAGHIVT